MNQKIRELAEQAGFQSIVRGDHIVFDISTKENLKDFAELIKQSIYDKVKEELIPDEVIAEEQVHHQEYLKGCNAGIVDALCYIKQFGVDE
jgi:hypothetical protein